MATINHTMRATPDARSVRVSWEGFAAAGDVGTAVELRGWRDRSVQILGSFGTGGEITLQGSNDGGVTWATLTDPQGNSLVKTSAALEAVTEYTGHVRPICTGGSGADIDVWMIFGGNQA